MSVAEVFPSEIVLFRMRRDQIGGPPIAGVVQAMQLAGDALRLSTATADQLNAAAGLLARALARFPDNASRDGCKFEAVGRLEVAGKVIGVELARRAFTPRTDERLQANE